MTTYNICYSLLFFHESKFKCTGRRCCLLRVEIVHDGVSNPGPHSACVFFIHPRSHQRSSLSIKNTINNYRCDKIEKKLKVSSKFRPAINDNLSWEVPCKHLVDKVCGDNDTDLQLVFFSSKRTLSPTSKTGYECWWVSFPPRGDQTMWSPSSSDADPIGSCLEYLLESFASSFSYANRNYMKRFIQ